jgi:hypothetical protein
MSDSPSGDIGLILAGSNPSMLLETSLVFLLTVNDSGMYITRSPVLFVAGSGFSLLITLQNLVLDCGREAIVLIIPL